MLPAAHSDNFRGMLGPAILAACLLASAPALAQAPGKAPAKPADVPALLKTASDALDRKDFAAAAKALSAVVEAEPGMHEAWFNLAYAYTGLNQDEDAVKAYQKTLQLQPSLFEAHLNLGILLMEMKRAAEAALYLEEAAELQPAHVRAHLYYGRALAATGKPEPARKHFEEALRLDPSLVIGHFDVGQLLLAQKDFASALAAFTKAAELDPKFAQANLGRALTLHHLGRSAEAVESFENYLAANPQDIETRFHLARIFLELSQDEKALENLKIVHGKDARLPGIAAALGDLHARKKEFTESTRFYREAVEAAPNNADLHRALGQTLMHLEKYTEAEGEFRACLKLDSKNLDAFRGVAMSLYLQKRYPEAIPLLERQAAAADAPAPVFFLLATSYDHLHIREKALENYERFLQLSVEQSPDQEWQARQRAKLLRRELRK